MQVPLCAHLIIVKKILRCQCEPTRLKLILLLFYNLLVNMHFFFCFFLFFKKKKEAAKTPKTLEVPDLKLYMQP